jgi:hypothetical protein
MIDPNASVAAQTRAEVARQRYFRAVATNNANSGAISLELFEALHTELREAALEVAEAERVILDVIVVVRIEDISG